MKPTEQLIFPPFRLDPVNEQLWSGSQLVPLRPKAFAVLRFLVEHAGRLLTKEELLKGVWPDTHVSEGILKGYIRDLRDILGDDAQHPHFIETVPRRGHRFIAAVSTTRPTEQSATVQVTNFPPSSVSGEESKGRFSRQPRTWNLKPETLLVGRETELAQLDRLFAKALHGERQIVFVTGEAGIGKTTLVDTFLQHLASERSRNLVAEPASSLQSPVSSLWLGRGQCVEQYGAGEAYLPILEALGRIGRAPGGDQLVTILRQNAPTWLVQMPALLTAEELEAVQRRVIGATRERMLREMVEAIEALAEQHPLVLWLEDLHWADASTVEWLASVAQRGTPARLLVIGTYRPSDLSLLGHPLKAVKQEFVAKGQCEELWLPFLTADDVTQYLTKRYAQTRFPTGLGTAIHQRTDGNPLFVVNMVEYLVAQRVIAEVDGCWQLQTAVSEVGRGVPESLRQLIDKHLERLSEEHQRLLEVASVVGVTFSAAVVAAGAEISVAQVEELCEGLVRRGQFLQAQEPQFLPDGTLCGSYGFQHALQHAVVYERMPNLRRMRLHRRVADGEEQIYGARAHEIAAELAVHFERGGELNRAVQYRQQAGQNALRQHGYQEAIAHFRRGVDLLLTLPDTPERRQQELAFQVALGSPLQALEGYGAPEVETVYTRARELSQQIGETAQMFPVLRGLYVFYLLRGKIQAAHELGARLFSLAQSIQDAAFLLEAHFAVGQTLMFRGEFVAAREHLEQGIALYDPVRHHAHAFLYGQDPGVFCQILAAWNLCFLGYPDQALRTNHEALIVAQEVAHPLSLAAAQAFFSITHQFRREGPAAQEHAEATIAFCSQQGFPFFLAFGVVLRGWALVEQGRTEEGIAQIRKGLIAYRATGAELATVRFSALLAEAWGKAGRPGEGLTVLAEALMAVNKDGERDYEAELYRIKGELTLQKFQVPGSQFQATDPRGEAEACFRQAIAIAQKQHAKSLELRAVMSLVRLWRQQAKTAEARQMLVEIYGWFTEGFDTRDLQDAKALLDALA